MAPPFSSIEPIGRAFMRMFALLTSVTFLIAVMVAAAIEPGIGDATATLLFGVQY
jgi:hypothetical protein